MMPTKQTCFFCGRAFMGSDCLGRPCPSCDGSVDMNHIVEAHERALKAWHAGECKPIKEVIEDLEKMQ